MWKDRRPSSLLSLLAKLVLRNPKPQKGASMEHEGPWKRIWLGNS